MTSNPVLVDCSALAWSLWAELGVSGWARAHRTWFVDPEPLILFTAWLGDQDARLRDESTDWCIQFGNWISASRLTNLLAKSDSGTQASFGMFAATVAAHSTTRWRGGTEPRRFEPTGRSHLDAFRAPSQLSLRLRGLFGVGARAEILRALLATTDARTAPDIADEIGFGRPIVARTLDELRRSDVVRARRMGNRLHYHLQDLAAWLAVIGDLPSVWPRWSRVLPLIALTTHELERARNLSPRVRLVELHRAQIELATLAFRAGIQFPDDEPTERSDHLATLEDWLRQTVHDLSKAKSSVLRARTVA